MFFTGALSIKDKRVDKMLLARNVTGADIYYSPIAIWFLLLVILAGINYWLIFMLALSKYYPLFLIYLAIGYVVSAYLNNSFALTQDTLIVVNPNFPFRQFKAYSLADIKQITIDKTKHRWHYFFVIFSRNFVRIQTSQTSEKYFCVGLELDAFDENWTDKTMDTFHCKLIEKGVPTIFNLDND